jgi:hypothetical protein
VKGRRNKPVTGIWLTSYVFLWVVVAVLSFVSIGLLQRLGLLQRQIDDWAATQHSRTADPVHPAGRKATNTIPPPSEDGPVIGSERPELTLEAANTGVTLTPTDWQHEGGTLALFLTPTCESCQQLVEPLNQLVDAGLFKGQVLVILRANETAYQAFVSLFPIHAPVVWDQNQSITMSFHVHRSPSGLFYDAQGKLVRKGAVLTYEALLALLGDQSVAPEVFKDIYPQLEVSSALSED